MKKRVFSCVVKLTVASASLLLSALALSNSLEDTHRFRVGMYDQDVDVTGSVTKNPLPEIELDFDKVLGLENSSETYFFSYSVALQGKVVLTDFLFTARGDRQKGRYQGL